MRKNVISHIAKKNKKNKETTKREPEDQLLAGQCEAVHLERARRVYAPRKQGRHAVCVGLVE